MASATYGPGRAIAIGSVWFWEQSMLLKDDPWIIFMRNIISWITKNKANSPSQPLKILIISSNIRPELSSILRRARLYVSVGY